MTPRLVAFALLVLVACGAESTGGVRGTVTAGPTCPVETTASSCPPAVWTGTVRATTADGDTYEAVTDGSGVFELTLPPGTYVIAAVTDGIASGIPTEVAVGEGSVATVDLSVDTGIR